MALDAARLAAEVGSLLFTHSSRRRFAVRLIQALGAMNTRQVRWLAIGFVLAPLAAGLSWFILGITFGGFNDLPEALASILVVYIFSFPVIVAVGSATLALAHWLKIARWWVAVVVGLLSGALFGVLLNAKGDDLLPFALTGAAPAVFIWWCWRFSQAAKLPRHGT